MMPTRLYHITPLSNLASILQTGKLLSNTELQAAQLNYTNIAYEHIQSWRAEKIVPCGPGGSLHDYVPFYFAPRSPMLYAIHTGHVQGYRAAQSSILHLVAWTEDIFAEPVLFVFSDGHAVIGYTRFYDQPDDLQTAIDWEIMAAQYWNDTLQDGDRKRRRQAEFLIYQEVPWQLIRGIGVMNQAIADQVRQVLQEYGHNTPVAPRPHWYY